MRPIAIIVVGYNRPDALGRLLKSLEKAEYGEDNIPLIISIDHSGTDEVVKLAESFQWQWGEKRVLCHEKRLGLRNHILSCGDLSRQYGAVMLLEDDLYVAPHFYAYAMRTLKKYGEDEHIAGISLYTERSIWERGMPLPFMPFPDGYDIFFYQWAQSWGQVWNNRMWEGFRAWYAGHQEMPQGLDMPQSFYHWPESSWAKFFQAYLVDSGKYFVYSRESYTTNFGDAGVHFSELNGMYQSSLAWGDRELRLPDFGDTEFVYDSFSEPRGLGKHLGIPEEQISCCLYGERPDQGKRYLLSGRPLPYQAIACFALAMKPVEWNIIRGIPGEDIFLYDTEKPLKASVCPESRVEEKWLAYAFGELSFRSLLLLLRRKLADRMPWHKK